MIQVSQSTLGGIHGPPEERGDCFSACLASILELPLSEVPRFCEIDGSDWGDDIDDWLSRFDLFYVEIRISEYFKASTLPRCGYYILCGDSPRERPHSVVGFKDTVYWDPHPDRTGLKGTLTDWAAGFLIPRHPTIKRGTRT